MTRILLDLREDVIGGTAETTGTLVAARTHVRIDGSVITYPAELRFQLPDDEIDLDPPALGEAWTLRLYTPTQPGGIWRTVRFTGTQVAWADLIDVDPRTVQPETVNGTAAWLAAVQDVQDAADAAIAQIHAASAGDVYTQPAPAGQWSIPHGFGRRPNVELYLPDGTLMLADVVATATLVTVTFATPTAGSAVLT